ncbi:hypothetical protein BDP27DRAFT_1228343 [Rhodocollybia butyracea]|uniref:Uncharacterized protein n=1 Tax=Rhodocollybia butyracea TaxID=206335 RepID=A0A9P5PM89_9AGAR|nr:hypothetical protein BDP27DRAFT_1228343 [Rhodocollybia butyracea]
MQLPNADKQLQNLKTTLKRQEQALRIEGLLEDYKKLASSPFLDLCLNAQAVKMHLHDRLKVRKFKHDRMERSFQHQQYNEQKLTAHAADSVKQRDPTIQRVAKTYNTLCATMRNLICAGKAPHYAVAPEQIPMENLFGLDVDDAIWQDVGLDGDGETLNPPLWLCNDKVWNGIKGVLLRDWCDEELCRLANELVIQ